MILSSCGPIAQAGLGALTGGGPSLDAQVGAQNEKQTLDNRTIRAGNNSQVTTNESASQAQRIDNFTQNNIPMWVFVVSILMAGFLIPSPKEIWKMIFKNGK